MIKIAMVNQKGGVTKTTSAVNISSSLSEMGYKVLAVDLDPQGNLGYNFGLDTDNLEKTVYDLFTKDVNINDIIIKTEFNIDVLPSNLLFANAELEISSKMNREGILKKAFKNLETDYDFVIIDLPPSLGLLSLNGLALADNIIIPLDNGIFSLSGLKQLLGVINLIKENDINPSIDIIGVLLTKVDKRTNMSKEMYSNLEELFGEKVFKTQIHQNIKIAESQKAQKPINYFLPNNRGSIEYKELAKELVERVNK